MGKRPLRQSSGEWRSLKRHRLPRFRRRLPGRRHWQSGPSWAVSRSIFRAATSRARPPIRRAPWCCRSRHANRETRLGRLGACPLGYLVTPTSCSTAPAVRMGTHGHRSGKRKHDRRIPSPDRDVVCVPGLDVHGGWRGCRGETLEHRWLARLELCVTTLAKAARRRIFRPEAVLLLRRRRVIGPTTSSG